MSNISERNGLGKSPPLFIPNSQEKIHQVKEIFMNLIIDVSAQNLLVITMFHTHTSVHGNKSITGGG